MPKKRTVRVDTPDPDERVSILNLKGTTGYREWLTGIHKKTYIPVATIVRLALSDWAEKHGHPKPPSEI